MLPLTTVYPWSVGTARLLHARLYSRTFPRLAIRNVLLWCCLFRDLIRSLISCRYRCIRACPAWLCTPCRYGFISTTWNSWCCRRRRRATFLFSATRFLFRIYPLIILVVVGVIIFRSYAATISSRFAPPTFTTRITPSTKRERIAASTNVPTGGVSNNT